MWRALTSALGLALVLATATGSIGAHRAAAQLRDRAARAAELRAHGDALRAAGDRGSAIGWYRDAISADPSDARSYERLGRIYLERGALGDARQVLEAGAARCPDDVALWLALSDALARMGSAEEAARALRSLTERAPRAPEAWIARAEAARARGAWSEALGAYRALIALAGDGVEIDPARVEEARRATIALGVLVGSADPVHRGCEGARQSDGAVRRALAGCDAAPPAE